jgi:hypothetical protein
MQVARTTRLALVAALVLVLVPLRFAARTHAAQHTTYEDLYYLPPAQWLPVLSLGHNVALADLLWIRSLVYVGDEYGDRGAMRHIFDYTETMLTLDPEFEAAYHWIATMGLYQPGGIERADLLTTVSLLERGVERVPESARLQWDLGATLTFESAPYAENDAERDEWRLRGIEHLMIATRRGAAPPWMVLSNTSMLLRVGASEQALAHLEEMYAAVDDEETRATIAARIAELRGESHAEAFVEESDAIEEARAHAFPYIHPHLYFLLGPRPPIDIDSSLRDGYAAHAFDGEFGASELP